MLALLAVIIAYADYQKPSDIDSLVSALAANPSLTERALAVKTVEVAKVKKPPSQNNNPNSQILAGCLMLAANTYNIPAEILVGILNVNSKKLKEKRLKADKISIMGIPEKVIGDIATEWKMSETSTKNLIQSNKCAAMNVAAWFLSKNHDIDTSYKEAIQLYNQGTTQSNSEFYEEVIKSLKERNLIKSDNYNN